MLARMDNFVAGTQWLFSRRGQREGESNDECAEHSRERRIPCLPHLTFGDKGVYPRCVGGLAVLNCK